MPGTCAREAPPAAAAITVACSALESLWLLCPRHWPHLRVRVAMRSNRHAQRAALSRQSLANSLVCDDRSYFLSAGPETSSARSGADYWPAQLV